MNYPQELVDLFSVNPIGTPCFNNLKSLHRYIDAHLKVLRGVAVSVREDLAFCDRPLTDLLQALEEALRWLQEDPERHSQILVDDEIDDNPTSG